VPTFSTEVVSAILSHMNGDHSSDNLLIARAFGAADATESVMSAVDDLAGTWIYSANGVEAELRIPWTAPISERVEIRREIVVVYENACARLGLAPRTH
jgi:Protein of unknown function (DUF2470)